MLDQHILFIKYLKYTPTKQKYARTHTKTQKNKHKKTTTENPHQKQLKTNELHNQFL